MDIGASTWIWAIDFDFATPIPANEKLQRGSCTRTLLSPYISLATYQIGLYISFLVNVLHSPHKWYFQIQKTFITLYYSLFLIDFLLLRNNDSHNQNPSRNPTRT